MTGLLHEKEFSRKAFLKGGGALIVGFSAVTGGLAGKARAAESPFASNGPFDIYQLDSWLTIHGNNTASIIYNYPETGNGSSTGMAQVAAEELDLDISQVSVLHCDTNVGSNGGGPVGASACVRSIGPKLRAAAATARQALLALASTQLGVPTSALSVSNGVVSGGGKSVSYGQLIGDRPFNVTMPASYNLDAGNAYYPENFSHGLNPGVSPTKPVSQYKLVGTGVPRIDIPDKVTGKYTYVHNVRVPGMLHGRVVQPRGQGAYAWVPKPLAIDESSIKHIAGARVVRKNDFVGVVAPHEYDAIQAAAQLKVRWDEPPSVLGSTGGQFGEMRREDAAGETKSWIAASHGDVDAALASAAHVVSRSYETAVNLHGYIGPPAAIADVTPLGARVFAYSQQMFGLRTELARLLDLPEKLVHVTLYEGSGSYGYGDYDNPTYAAAVMSQIVGKPVRVQYMRWDEHGWSTNDRAILTDFRAGIDSKGNIVGVDFTGFSTPYLDFMGRPVQSSLGEPLFWLNSPASTSSGAIQSSSGGARLDVQKYNVPNLRWTSKQLPPLKNLRSDWMRGVDPPRVDFGYEQVIDELAHAAKMDPLAFRRQNASTDPVVQRPGGVEEQYRQRLFGVLDAVARAAQWQPRTAASNLSDANVVTGRGMAVHEVLWADTWTAAVADIEVNKKTGKIVPKHIFFAADAGLIVNPVAAKNSLLTGAVQDISKSLVESVTFNKKQITSLDWAGYPILRFKDAPKMTVVLVNRPDQPPKGVGEQGAGPCPAAIANAFFDATGVRITHWPMNPAAVRATLKAGGVA